MLNDDNNAFIRTLADLTGTAPTEITNHDSGTTTLSSTRGLETLIRLVVREEVLRHMPAPQPNQHNAEPSEVPDEPTTVDELTNHDASRAGVMSADDVAAFLGVDRNTVYEYAGRGTIPCRRLGKRLLFHKPALVAWLDPCKAASTRKG